MMNVSDIAKLNTFEERETYFKSMFDTTPPDANSNNEKLFVATKINGKWMVKIPISLGEEINLHTTGLFQETREASAIILTCDEDSYECGDTIKLDVSNVTQNIDGIIYINISELDIPTFATWAQAHHYINIIPRKFNSSADVNIDESLQVDIKFSEETINAFKKTLRGPIDFTPSKQPKKISIDYNSLDNSNKFFIVNPVDGKWLLELSADMISTDWNKGDEIYVHTLMDTSFNSDTGLLTFISNIDANYESQTIILDIKNVTKDKEESIFINFSTSNKLKFISDESAELYGIFKKELYEIHEKSKINTRYTTAQTRYQIYTSSDSLYSTEAYNSPFKAINIVLRDRLNGYKVKQTNDLQTIFQLSAYSRTTFYRFQYTQFYGSANAYTANNWYNYIGANFAHIVRCDGIFGCNELPVDSQPKGHSYVSYLNPTEDYMLEGNTGGYVFNYALSYEGYRAMKAKIRLGRAIINKNDMKVNPYVYINVTNNWKDKSYGVDLGLIYISDQYGTGWYLCKNPSEGSLSTSREKRILAPNRDADVELYFRYRDGQVILQAINKTDNIEETISHEAEYWDTCAIRS